MKKRIRGKCNECGSPVYGRKSKLCRTCFIKSVSVDKEQIKEYRRFWHIKRKYGIEKEEFELLWNKSTGTCFICGEKLELPGYRNGRVLKSVAVDHDHKTGKVRGLLCGGCNRAIGYFKENINSIQNSITYITNGGCLCQKEV